MKKTNVNNPDAITGGHRLYPADIAHLNEAIVEVAQALALGLAPIFTHSLIYGLVFTTASGTVSWTAGAIAAAGEIFFIDAGSIGSGGSPQTMSSIRLNIVTTYRVNDPIEYADANLRNVHEIRKVTFATSGTVSGLIITAEALDKKRLHKVLFGTDWIEVEDGDMTNGWLNYSPASAGTKFAYRETFQGTLELRGSIKAGTLSATIFQLPVGFRPTASKLFSVVVSQGVPATTNLNGSIDTSGNVKLFGSGTFSDLYANMEVSVSS